jgi:hypothetical protein
VDEPFAAEPVRGELLLLSNPLSKAEPTDESGSLPDDVCGELGTWPHAIRYGATIPLPSKFMVCALYWKIPEMASLSRNYLQGRLGHRMIRGDSVHRNCGQVRLTKEMSQTSILAGIDSIWEEYACCHAQRSFLQGAASLFAVNGAVLPS